jgi:hypothetical protein
LSIAFAEQSAQTNGGDMVKLLEQGGDMMITAANKHLLPNKTSTDQSNDQSSRTSSSTGQMPNLWVEMWFDKLEELDPKNRTVVFSIPDLASTNFDLTSGEEVDFDNKTRAYRFNYSASLSNGAMLFISVFPHFFSKNATEGGNSSMGSSPVQSSPIIIGGSPSVVESSPVQSPVQSSPVQSPVQSSPVVVSPVVVSPVESSPQTSPVQQSPQSLQAMLMADNDANFNNRSGDNNDHPNMTHLETKLADGYSVPYSALKFAVWITGWPFVNQSNVLRLAAILTSADTKNGTAVLEGRYCHVGSGFIISEKNALYDGKKDKIDIDVYHGDQNDGVMWTFKSFEHELFYDPVFGYSSSALHIIPSVTTLLLILLMSMIRL